MGIGFGALLLGLHSSTNGLPFNQKYSVIDKVQNWSYQLPVENPEQKYNRIIIDQETGIYHLVDQASKQL